MGAARICFGLYGAAVGALCPFLAVIPAGRGFNSVQIGAILAVGALAHVVAVPGWGRLADEAWGDARAIRIGAIGSAILPLGFFFDWPLVVLAAMLALLPLVESGISPILDGIAVADVAHAPNDYAKARLVSSVTFATSVIACGLVYGLVGYWPATVIWAALLIALATASGRLPRRMAANSGVNDTPSGPRLVMTPSLATLMVAVFLANVGMSAALTFYGLRLTETGGGSTEIAAASSIAAFLELPTWPAAIAFIGFASIRWLFVGSSLAFALVIASWAVVATPAGLVATRGLTGVAFAGLWVASVFAVRTMVPEGFQASGQGLFQLTAFGLATLAANTIGGWVFDRFGSAVLFGIAATCMGVAALVGWHALSHRHAVKPTARTSV